MLKSITSNMLCTRFSTLAKDIRRATRRHYSTEKKKLVCQKNIFNCPNRLATTVMAGFGTDGYLMALTWMSMKLAKS